MVYFRHAPNSFLAWHLQLQHNGLLQQFALATQAASACRCKLAERC